MRRASPWILGEIRSAAWLLFAVLLVACGDEKPAERLGPPDIGPGEIHTITGAGVRATDLVDSTGDGEVDPPIPAMKARFDSPMDVAFDPEGRMIVIDWNGHKIRRLEEDYRVSFVTGTGIEGDACEGGFGPEGCPADRTQVNHPTDVTFDAEGNLYIAAWHNSKIKRLDFEAMRVADICGTGQRMYRGDGGPCLDDAGEHQVAFDLPSGVRFDRAGNLLLSDQANQVIRRIRADGIVETVAGHCPGTAGFGCPAGRGYAGDGGPAREALLNNNLGQGTDPQGKFTLDGEGNLYIADTGNHVIRKVTPGSDGILGDGDPGEEIITTVAGTGEQAGYAGDGGPATAALLSSPTDVAVASDGTVYIADRGNHCIRSVSPDGVISTAAGVCGTPGFDGDGGPAVHAWLHAPYGVEVDAADDLYIADTFNHCIRKVVIER